MVFSLVSKKAAAHLAATVSTTLRMRSLRLLSSSSTSSILSYRPHGRLKLIAGGCLVGCAGLQAMYGSEDDFYEYRFITDKDPDDLFSFYGGEEFMELFCVMPFMVSLMMRNGTFDDEGTIHTTGIPGDLQVSMVFSDKEDEATGETLWFNKRERFKDVMWNRKMWDMVTNFGFHKLPDGRIECYHHGEYFRGHIPPISLIIKLVFQIHARWVAWATEHHINHHAFTSETEEEEMVEEMSRSNIVWHLLEHHVWVDVKAMVFGLKTTGETKKHDEVSFLVKKEHEEGEIATEAVTIKRSLTRKLMEDTRKRIEEDIKMDREMSQANIILDESQPRSSRGDAYRRLTKSAMQRHQTLRVAKRMSTRKATKKTDLLEDGDSNKE